jgi:hypothetical protein
VAPQEDVPFDGYDTLGRRLRRFLVYGLASWDLVAADARIGGVTGSVAVFGLVARWTLGVLVLLCAAVLAGCLGSGESRRSSGEACLTLGGSRPPSGRPAAVALLAEVEAKTGKLRGGVNRLLRVSIPGGGIELERRLGPGSGQRDVDRPNFLDVTSGPLLATAPDGKTVLALIRTVSGRDSVMVTDAQSLQTRCSHPLEPGIHYSGLLLGRSGMFYAYGAKRVGSRRWDAALTIGDARTGDLKGSHTLRQAERGDPAYWGKNWLVYWGALSADERRLVLSHHGGDTTGADWFRISPTFDISAGRMAERCCEDRAPRWPCGPGRTDVPRLHGAVTAVGAGFVGATGTNDLLELDRGGHGIARLRVRENNSHLMDFALDDDHGHFYVSSCARRPTIQHFDLERGRRGTGPVGPSAAGRSPSTGIASCSSPPLA